MSITYSEMHSKGLINPSRHVIDKSQCTCQYDVIMITFYALQMQLYRRIYWFSTMIVVFYRLTGDYEQKFNRAFIFKHNVFYIVRLFFSEEFCCFVEMPYFVHWRLGICLRNRSFARSYTQQIVIRFWT